MPFSSENQDQPLFTDTNPTCHGPTQNCSSFPGQCMLFINSDGGNATYLYSQKVSMCERWVTLWKVSVSICEKWQGPGQFPKIPFHGRVLPIMFWVLLILWKFCSDSPPFCPAGECGRTQQDSRGGRKRMKRSSDAGSAIHCRGWQKSSPTEFKAKWFPHCNRK